MIHIVLTFTNCQSRKMITNSYEIMLDKHDPRCHPCEVLAVEHEAIEIVSFIKENVKYSNIILVGQALPSI